MTSRPPDNQTAGEPRPDPRLEYLIRQAVASQSVPLARQQAHLARIKQYGQASTALNPWIAQDGRRDTMLTDDHDGPIQPASGRERLSATVPPTRTRRRQLTELTFGLLGFVVVAALLVALFRQDPEDNLGAVDPTSTVTPTTAITPTPTTLTRTATVPIAAIPTETPSTQPPSDETPVVTFSQTPEPTATGTSEVPLTNEQTMDGYGVLTQWDAKVHALGAMTAGPDDRIYALDLERGQVAIYELGLAQVGSIELTAGVPLASDQHFDIAVDGNGAVYLLDGTAGRVTIYSADNIIVGGWDGSSDAGTEASAGALVNPLAIAVDENGLVYVTEALPDGRGRIRSFTQSGIEVTVWWNAGEDELPANLQAIEVVGTTISVLADSSDVPGTILQFNALDGSFIREVAAFSDDEPDIIRRAFAVDNAGNLFAVDPTSGDVVGISPTSSTLLYWIPDEYVDGIERTPNTHVAVDSRGYIYILQSHRVMMTVLAPSEAVEEARQPSFNVLPHAATCADTFTAYGANYLDGDQITILASVADGAFVEVGRGTVVDAAIEAPLSLGPLGVCDSEIDLDGVEVTFIAQPENDSKQPDPVTITLFSADRTPSLTLTPVTGDCTTAITATGTDFVPDTTVTLMLTGHSPLPLAHGVPVDDDGTFTVELSVAEFYACLQSPDNPLTTEVRIVASTEWPDKREPYPWAQATFTVGTGD